MTPARSFTRRAIEQGYRVNQADAEFEYRLLPLRAHRS